MAEGFAKKYGKNLLEIYSAGTHPASGVNPIAIEVMKEKEIDISGQFPKLLDQIPARIDYLISMGCGVVCPFIPNAHQEDWGIEDPVGLPIDVFRQIRDQIEEKVKELIQKIQSKSI